jgi:hypothetical protein
MAAQKAKGLAYFGTASGLFRPVPKVFHFRHVLSSAIFTTAARDDEFRAPSVLGAIDRTNARTADN